MWKRGITTSGSRETRRRTDIWQGSPAPSRRRFPQRCNDVSFFRMFLAEVVHDDNRTVGALDRARIADVSAFTVRSQNVVPAHFSSARNELCANTERASALTPDQAESS